MQHDSLKASLVWGRIGGAVLCLAGVGLSAFGVDFSAEEQQFVVEHVDKLLIILGALMGIGSKLREKVKDK